MKKLFLLLSLAAVCLSFSCKNTVQIVEKPVIQEGDTKAPGEVTKLKVSETGSDFVTLSWTNPSDEDLFGIQISMKPAEAELEEPVIISKNKTSYTVKNLTSNKEYTFTVKTTDRKLNLSKGVVVKATPVSVPVPPVFEESVSDATVAYDSDENKITVSWDGRDSQTNIKVVLIKDGTVVAEEVITDPDVNSYEFTGVNATEENYTVSVIVMDKDNNTGIPKDVEIKATAKPFITDVILLQNHVSSVKNIEFKVIGSKLAELKELKAQILYKDEIAGEYDITDKVDPETGVVQVSIPCPVSLYKTEGRIYSIKISGFDSEDDVVFSPVMPEIVVSSGCKVAGIAVTDFIRQDAGSTSLMIYGTNLDLLTTSNAIIKDSSNKQVSSTPVSPRGNDSEVMSVTVPVPESEGTYTISFMGKEVSFVVYAKVELDDIFIPQMGAAYAGNKAQIEIKGKNFSSNYFNLDYFVVSGLEVSDMSVMSDTRLIANIVCPENATDGVQTYALKMMYEDSVCQKQCPVLPENQCDYTPGDVIMQDGTRFSYATITEEGFAFTDEQKAKVAGIVGGVRYGGGDVIVIAKTYSNINLLATDITSTNTPGWLLVAKSYEGQNIWNYLCEVWPDWVKNAQSSLPGFYYAHNYGSSFEGEYSSGWYVPSNSELSLVTANYETLKKSFAKIGASYPNSTVSNFNFKINGFTSCSCVNTSGFTKDIYYRVACQISDTKYDSTKKNSVTVNYISFTASGIRSDYSGTGTKTSAGVSTNFSATGKLYVLPVHKLVR